MFSKIFDKITIVIVALLLIMGFRELVLTDTAVSRFFAELIGMLPFAKQISYPIIAILKCEHSVPIISSIGVTESILRLVVMAFLQPLITGTLYRVFLPLPSHSPFFDLEAYMSSTGYRVKAFFINILSAPLLAACVAWLLAYAMKWLSALLGNVGAILTALLAIVIVFGLSLIPLVIKGTTLLAAFLWRLLVDLVPELLKVTVTNALCIAFYAALVGGVQNQAVTLLIILFIWLGFWSFGISLMSRCVAKINLGL